MISESNGFRSDEPRTEPILVGPGFVALDPQQPPTPDRERLLVWSKLDWKDAEASRYVDPGNDVEQSSLSVTGSESILRGKERRMFAVTTITGGEYFFAVVRKALRGCVMVDRGFERPEPFIFTDGKGVLACYRGQNDEPKIFSRRTLVADYFRQGKSLFFVQPTDPEIENERYRITRSVASIQTVSHMPEWVDDLLDPQ
jgi:hypothetical protein